MNTVVGSLSLLQGIFPIQGWNWGLLHFRLILYHLSYQESPKRPLIFVNNERKLYFVWWKWSAKDETVFDAEERGASCNATILKRIIQGSVFEAENSLYKLELRLM